jgi:hypothetical protein
MKALIRQWLAAVCLSGLVGFAVSCAHAQDISIGAGLGNAGFPTGATPATAAASGTTAGATATLAAAPTRYTYICGLSVSPGAATAAITITVTTTGLTNNFTWNVGAPAVAAGTTAAILTVTFPTCLPSSAINTGIAVTAGALGTGGVGQNVNTWGFQQ